MPLAFKISPLFHFDLLPFGYQSTGPRPSHQAPPAALARERHGIAAQEACWGQCSFTCPLGVSCHLFGSLSLDGTEAQPAALTKG